MLGVTHLSCHDRIPFICFHEQPSIDPEIMQELDEWMIVPLQIHIALRELKGLLDTRLSDT
jgi:hypothetical protein